MKTIILIVGTLLLALHLTGCATTRSNTHKADDTNVLVMVDGFTSPLGTADHGFETAVLEIAVKLGVQAAKALIDTEARRYEASYNARDTARWEGMQRVDLDSAAVDWQLKSAKVLVFTRTIQKQESGLKWQWTDPQRTELITSIVHSAGAWITKDDERKHLSASLATNLPASGYPTFVCAFIVKPVNYERNAKAGPSEAMSVSLIGYMYPALSAKRSALKIPFTKWDRVETAVAIKFTGPEGQRGYLGGKYESGVVFRLKTIHSASKEEAAEKWANSYDKWVPMPKGKKNSKPLAIPGNPVVVSEVKVVESSNMKKRLEELGKAVGDLKPKSFGVGD